MEQTNTAVALQLSFDEDGFLADPNHWSKELAEELAVAADVAPLSEAHWATIGFVRDKYFRLGSLPPMRHVCRRLGLVPGEIRAMFGGCAQLWQIAGLPNPGEQASAYMN